MKKKYKVILILIAIIVGITCKKNLKKDKIDITTVSLKDYSYSQSVFNDIFKQVYFYLKDGLLLCSESIKLVNSIGKDYNQYVMTYNKKYEKCLEVYRYGKIFITIKNDSKSDINKIIITFDSFFVNYNKVEGKMILNIGQNKETIEREIQNARISNKLIGTLHKNININYDNQIILIKSIQDIQILSGITTGIGTDRIKFRSVILFPPIQISDCFYQKEGQFVLQIDGQYDRFATYRKNCTDILDVIINNNKYNVKLDF